jgi:type II secretory pathway predicted ATPase ExeA
LPRDDQEQFVSRYHCQLDISPTTVRLRDLQSKNGTYVNGRKIGADPIELINGDRIKLGKTIFQVEIRKPDDEDSGTHLLREPVEAATHLLHDSSSPRGSLAIQEAITEAPQRPTSQPDSQFSLSMVGESSQSASFNAMYFGFRRKPFQGSGLDFLRAYPDYEICYAQLLDSIGQAQKLVMLLGEAGTGKSLLLGNLVRDPTVGFKCVLCKSPGSYDDLLNLLCSGLGLSLTGSERPYKIKALMDYMGSPANRGTVLLIDNADKLDPSTIRHLLNLLRLGLIGSIVFAGLPQLREQLSRLHGDTPEQTVKSDSGILGNITCITLRPLNRVQVEAFIRQQLHVAGNDTGSLFSKAVIDRIASLSRGTPGLINALCDRTLLLTETAGENSVSLEVLNTAAEQLKLSDAVPHSEVAIVTASSSPFDNSTSTQSVSSSLLTVQSQPQFRAQSASSAYRKLWLVALLLLVLLGGIGMFFALRAF